MYCGQYFDHQQRFNPLRPGRPNGEGYAETLAMPEEPVMPGVAFCLHLSLGE